MPLDSDLPNADNNLSVEFYLCDREIGKGQTFVRVQVPGDQLNVVDRPMREGDKQRFTRQWLHFQMKNSDAPIQGIRVDEWRKDRPNDLSEVQLQELQILKFFVVEQVAMASDSQCQRIGMGGLGLRTAAQNYLREKSSLNSSTELDDTKRQLAELQATVAALMAAQTTEKRGPGRPPKEA